MGSVVKHLVVDSGAFIRNAPIKDIGETVYTIEEVVNEIRDKATKQRLQVLPYDLKFRSPSTEAIKFVTEFSKRTGDYASLSAVDLQVLALAYQLEKEKVGTDHIRLQPPKKEQWTATKGHLEKPTAIAGFYLGSGKTTKSRTTSESSASSEAARQVTQMNLDESEHAEAADNSNNSLETEETTMNSRTNSDLFVQTEQNSSHSLENMISDKKSHDADQRTPLADKSDDKSHDSKQVVSLADGDTLTDDVLEYEDEEDAEDEDDDDDDDDDGGWITPSNIHQIRQQMGDHNTQRADVEVGCITTDFAMQNVLIQMGLNVVSVDGMLIKQAKSYVLRCFACFKITTNMMKAFCPNCGNQTLQKIAMTVGDDGSVHYHLSRRKPVTARGLKYSLPTPKGGKHAVNPILCPDQPVPHNRVGKIASKGKLNVFDPDFIASSSPFSQNDIHSRAAQLGLRGNKGDPWSNRRNPNEGKRKRGRRK
ncbi:RNA-binding protein NOB1 [Lingula anatina]|uniref:RNA-binding protein NOB1 n=1 Tax=Lingula anatina TaxID=7574 RepID=A0A1S3H696_LINAN|nr:RNA-binding protein NOB1 [Lingula anatina]|eukprot:XP_013380649.1 RNA-binding protein NOB1 [Lingula anatina]